MARVASSAASSKTVGDRVQTLEGIRDTVSGGESAIQISSEVTAQSPEYQVKLLDELFRMPGKFIVNVPPTESLALKSDLQLPWAKLQSILYIRSCLGNIMCNIHVQMDEVLGSLYCWRKENERSVQRDDWRKYRGHHDTS